MLSRREEDETLTAADLRPNAAESLGSRRKKRSVRAAVEECDRVLRCALYWQYSRLRQASENTGVARAIVFVAPVAE